MKRKGESTSQYCIHFKIFDSRKNDKNDRKVEILYELQSLIVAAMSGNYVPSMPSINNIKAAIGSSEATNQLKQKNRKILIMLK